MWTHLIRHFVSYTLKQNDSSLVIKFGQQIDNMVKHRLETSWKQMQSFRCQPLGKVDAFVGFS